MPHTGQRIVRTQARRHCVLAAGRRWRKTTLVMSIAVEEAAKGKTVIWGAPVFDQVRICWAETRKAAGNVAEFRQNTMTASFPGGGKIIYRSLDHADNVRGYTADGVVVDEAGAIRQESAWYEVLRPMLIDTGGWSWLIGTPKGQNMFWKEFHRTQDREDAIAWSAPTLGVQITDSGLVRNPHPLENPFIPFTEMQAYFYEVPQRVFEQELLCEFHQDGNGVFRRVREAVDQGRNQNADPTAGRRRYMGVDLARVNDYTVLCVLEEEEPRKLYRQVYHERFNQISWQRQVAAITQAARRYGVTSLVMDSTGVGDPIFEALRRENLPVTGYHFTANSKEQVIDGLALRLENDGLRLMDVPAQTNELLAYQYEITKAGNVRMSAPEGMFDDCCIALALANHATAARREWVVV